MKLMEITNSLTDIEKLREFYEGIYTQEFPDPDERELLDNIENYLKLKTTGWYDHNNYHVVLLLNEENVVGGVIADYFNRSNIGVIEFMVVAPAMRGQGLGKLLLEDIFQRLHKDAECAGFTCLNGIVGEVNDPYRRCDINEHLDGFARLRMWDRLGFSLLDFPYIQPALSAEQDAVTGLGLMFRPEKEEYRTQLPVKILEDFLADYQIWAMRISHPEERAEFRFMQGYLQTREAIPLLDMRSYICDEQSPPFRPIEINDNESDTFEQFKQIYRATFNHDETAVDVSEFNQATHHVTEGTLPYHYWLWGISATKELMLNGIASFFSLPHCGFGGYVALVGALKEKGHFRRFLRMMERQIVSVNEMACGWYVECEPGADEVAIFKKCGFTEVPMCYRQPRLHTDTIGTSDGKVLALLYKPFGRIYERPILPLEELQCHLKEILTRVYYLDSAQLDAAIARMVWPANAENVFNCD